MRQLVILFFPAMVPFILFTSCGCPNLTPGKAVHQTFYFQNNSNHLIAPARVIYGETILPSSRESYLYPLHRISGMSESSVLPIPKVIVINWTTSDGIQHSVSIPLLNLVREHKNLRGCFGGCKFVFTETGVDVYMIDQFIVKGGKAGRRYDSKFIQISSSPL